MTKRPDLRLTSECKKGLIAVLTLKARSIAVPYVRLDHGLSACLAFNLFARSGRVLAFSESGGWLYLTSLLCLTP